MTDMIKADEAVLKTDVLGRVKTPFQRREQLLDEFERSGLSGKKFAELVGVKYQTFATWAQRRRRQQGAKGKGVAPSTDPVRWLEAVVSQAQASGDTIQSVLVLELPGGTRLEISQEKQIGLAVALLRALAKPC